MANPTPRAQASSERAALSGDAASQALNEALRVSFLLLMIAMAFVALFFFGSGLFQVKEGEQAFVLRFGRIVTHRHPETGEETALLGPGFHFAWPFLIDEIVRFPVERSIEEPVDAFMYKERRDAAGNVSVPAGIAPGEGGFTLTGDANILHSKWRVQYRIADPVKFCGRLADPGDLAAEGTTSVIRQLIRSLLRNAVIRTMASYEVDDAYRRHKERLRREVERSLVSQMETLDVGILVTRVLLEAVVPPRQSKDAFDDVIQAEQQSSELILQAEGYYNDTVAPARGQARRIVAEAEAYKNRVQAFAEADADYLNKLLSQYGDDPPKLRIFLKARLVEVLEEVLTAADQVIVVEPGREVRIHISRKGEAKPKPEEPATEPQQPTPPEPHR